MTFWVENCALCLIYPVISSELALGLQNRLSKDFARFGLILDGLYITSITPPAEVQAAIDDRSRLSVIKDMDNFVRMKAAMSMEKAAESGGEAGAGLGLGLGMMMPGMFAGMQSGPPRKDGGPLRWSVTNHYSGRLARFCPYLRPSAGDPAAVRLLW